MMTETLNKEDIMHNATLYEAIDVFIDKLNWKYLEMRRDLGQDTEGYDIFGIDDWNYFRAEMKRSFTESGLDLGKWIYLMEKLLKIRDEDLSPLTLSDHDLGGIFSEAEMIKSQLETLSMAA